LSEILKGDGKENILQIDLLKSKNIIPSDILSKTFAIMTISDKDVNANYYIYDINKNFGKIPYLPTIPFPSDQLDCVIDSYGDNGSLAKKLGEQLLLKVKCKVLHDIGSA